MDKLTDWAQGFDFKHDHLVGGLTLAQYVCDGGEAYGRHIAGLGRPELLFPLATDLAFLVWVNDYIQFREPTEASSIVTHPNSETLHGPYSACMGSDEADRTQRRGPTLVAQHPR